VVIKFELLRLIFVCFDFITGVSVVSIFTFLHSYEKTVYFGPLKFKCLGNGIKAGQDDKNFLGRTLQQTLHSSVNSSPYYTVCKLEKRLEEMFNSA